MLLTPVRARRGPAGLEWTGDPAFNFIWTSLHVPCVTVPAGTGPNGLPLGIQIVGRARRGPRGARLGAMGRGGPAIRISRSSAHEFPPFPLAQFRPDRNQPSADLPTAHLSRLRERSACEASRVRVLAAPLTRRAARSDLSRDETCPSFPLAGNPR